MDTGFFEYFNNESKDVRIEEHYFNESEEFVLLKISGFIDTYNSTQFLREVTSFLEQKERKVLVLDLSGVSYMSSTGIGASVELNKFCIKNKIVLYFLGMQKSVKEVFSLLGFFSFFNYIDELKDIKEEKIHRSKFPATVQCPHCSKKYSIQKTGSFKCKGCTNMFRVIEKNNEIIIEKR